MELPETLRNTAPTTVSPSEAELRAFTHEQLVQYILQSRSAPSSAPEQYGRKREREGAAEEGAAGEGDDATAEAKADGGEEEEPAKKKAKAKKEFDMSRYHQRYIALKLAYLGWQYDGLAVQNDTDNTIETHLIAALKRVKLITDRPSSNYNRSGRTDKGVSALGNVISVQVRSNLKPANPIDENGVKAVIYADTPLDTSDPRKEEMPYLKMINSALPPDIQVLAWTTVPKDFSARFSTKHRTYKYFFLAENLQLERMREAAKKIEGEHDFRHFCKMDVVNVHNFVRTIYSFDIAPAESGVVPGVAEGSMYTMTICGQAFLWHQVRMMAAILFLVGSGQEEPTVVDELLDVAKFEGRPHYQMASEIPLVFWEAAYDEIEWTYDPVAVSQVHKVFSERWKWLSIQTAVAHAYRTFLEDRVVTVGRNEIKWREHAASQPGKPTRHVKLLARGKGDTYAARVARLAGRKRERYIKTSAGRKPTGDDGDDATKNST